MRGGFNRDGGMNRGGMWRGGPSRGRGFRGGFPGGFRGGFRGNRGNRPFGANSWHNRDASNSDQNSEKQSRTKPVGLRLTEVDVGATEYMNKHEGFTAIIKSRYSDFHVAEISERGEVAQLTSVAPPERPAAEDIDEDEELLLCKYNVEILPMDTWDRINKLLVGTLPPNETVEIDVTEMSKEDRTKIHDAVNKAFGGSIVGSTVNIEHKKLMRFEKFRKGVRIDNRVKWTWPGEFVHFLVYKENCDTMEAAARIAERLRMHMKPQVLGYAGTKDRRAKTTQWFSLRKTDPRKIAAAVPPSRMMVVGNYSFHSHGLQLGSLQGNRFRIALRNVTAEEAVVEAACERLRDDGFINYYGLQRFGARGDVPTHAVGRLLLKAEYKQAIDLILQETDGPLRDVLSIYARSGANAAACALPKRYLNTIEGRLLTTLAQRPRDYLTALQRVPRNTRLLYVHAYQSLVWNRAVSERLRRCGLSPVVGDAVPVDQHAVTDDITEELFDTEESESLTESLPDDSQETEQTDNQDNAKDKLPVKILTQEDVDSGKYTIFDLLMPLPGCKIEYPPNMVDYYETLLKNDGLALELISKHKSYTMSGAWRRVAARVKDMTWERARYAHAHADLLASDRDRLEGRTPPADTPDGKFSALLVAFSLPVSCYATMALRELLKIDTSSGAQAEMNHHGEKRPPGEEGDGETGKRARGDTGGGDEQ